MGGSYYRRSKILESVEATYLNNTYRKYELGHRTMSDGYQTVDYIQEFNGASKALKAIQFQYKDAKEYKLDHKTEDFKVSPGFSANGIRTIAADFTGNGSTDMIAYEESDKSKFRLYMDLMEGDNVRIGHNIETGAFKDIVPVRLLSEANTLLPQMGFSVIRETSIVGDETKLVFENYALASYGPVPQPSKEYMVPKGLKGSTTCGGQGLVSAGQVPKRYVSGDFNGDGISDVIALSKGHGRRYCTEVRSNGDTADTECFCTTRRDDFNRQEAYFFDLNPAVEQSKEDYVLGSMGYVVSDEDRIFSSDFDGDGKMELFVIKDINIMVYTLRNGRLEKLVDLSDTWVNLDKDILSGDFNGDGKTDIMISNNTRSDQWKSYTSNGTSFSTHLHYTRFRPSRVTTVGNEVTSEIRLSVQDFNGDGKSDILQQAVSNERSLSLSLWAATGAYDGYANFENKALGTFNGDHYKTGSIPIVIDPKSKNPYLEFAFMSDNTLNAWRMEKDIHMEAMMTTIENNGKTTEIEYGFLGERALYDGATLHGSDYSERYPNVNVNLAPSLFLVKQLEQTGSGLTRTRLFGYKGASVNLLGLGFQGFKVFQQTNWYGDGVTTLWNITRFDTGKRGAVIEQWIANHPTYEPSGYIKKTTYAYEDETGLPEHIYLNAPKTVAEHNELFDKTTTEVYEYDEYYNPTSITKSNESGSSVTSYTYINNEEVGNEYHIGRPATKTSTSTLDDHAFTLKESYAYEGNNLVEMVVEAANGEKVTETFKHNGYGNVTRSTLSAGDLTDRVQMYWYTTDGRFLRQYQDQEKLITKYFYDTTLGQVTQTHYPDGYKIVNEVDAWGRIVAEEHFLRNKTSYHDRISYQYLAQEDGGVAIESTRAYGANGKTVHNCFGWPVLESAAGFKGRWRSVATRYDVSGRPTQVSEPFWAGGSASQWHTTHYDQTGRIIETIAHTGRSTTYTHEKRVTTVYDGTKTVKVTRDENGLIESVEDPGGTIGYEYFGNGALKKATYGGVSVENQIDDWGRRIQLKDPSAGTYGYTFNLFGDLLEETGPRGKKTVYKPDAYGRTIKEISTGENTDLETDIIYNKLGQVTSISGTDGFFDKTYAYTYTYDAQKRLTQVKEENDHAQYKMQLQYGTDNRVSQLKYITNSTSGSGLAATAVVKHTYDTDSGILEKLSDANNAVLWQLHEETARGQAKRISLGNGHNSARNYDGFGFLKDITDRREEGGSSTTAMAMVYDFDALRGVLRRRKNLQLNWDEAFGYDELDRLTTINGPAPRTQMYSANGLIGDNSLIGAYSYGQSDKSYQLAGLDLNEAGMAHFQERQVQTITYNAFKKPVDIHEENQGRVSFEYGILGNRSGAWYGGGQEEKEERRYHKSYSAIAPVEIVRDTETGDEKIITYLGGDAYDAPVVHMESSNNDLDGQYYLHRDYLGSILAITDGEGNVREQRQFGAWGTVDKFLDANGEEAQFGHDSLLGRGYTGHEHFFEVGLIHMNGRMYDPVLGRFLSPDNYIQNPYNTQNFNRYGYVLNNPLIYTDPSGETVEPITALWAAAAVASSFAASYNWLNDQGVFRSVNKWFNKHIKGPVDDFFDWLHGRNKRKAPPPTPQVSSGSTFDAAPTANTGPAGNAINHSNGGSSESAGTGPDCPDCPDTDKRTLAMMMANQYGGNPQEYYNLLVDSEGTVADYAHENLETIAMFGLMRGPKASGGSIGRGWFRTQLSRLLSGVRGNIQRQSTQVFKAFTQSNYRHNLQVLTGKSGVGMDAHHIFPQANKFQSYFQRAGINIHDPKNLRWWKSGPHRRAANAYNNAWSEFFRATPNATRQQIESFGSALMKSYGF